MIVFAPYPIPVVTPLGDGYILYVKDNQMFENDEFAITLEEDGSVKHFLANDIKIFHNETYKIHKDEEDVPDDNDGVFYNNATFTNTSQG